MPDPCPFCQRLALPELLAESELAAAFTDGFPVSPGHSLIVPRRHVAGFFELTPEEQGAIWRLLPEVKARIEGRHSPAGYNIGINVGPVAGQTVGHVHVHLIPRYSGDMDDPTGGVRHVIPWKGNYRRALPAPLATGDTTDPFLEHIRPLWAAASSVDVVAAFVQDSGLTLLEEPVRSALDRGARVRLVTGDYLDITQAQALSRLLDWQGAPAEDDATGRFEARIIETTKDPVRAKSFHPKSWLFEGPALGAAFVGSSNVSASALRHGVEWNLRVDRWRDPASFDRVREAFTALWARALPLTAEWVAEYARRARQPGHLPPGEAEPEPLTPAPTPHPVQLDALDALAAARAEGKRRALVVMATGLGKTLLAALDAAAFGREAGRAPRVLFLAHRKELLAQAATTLRLVLREGRPDLTIGWYAEARSELASDVVVASVQKLGGQEDLALLATQAFDYVVVDEAHHSDAATYRRILARLSPGFLLGLTATPDRADEGDILGLFDDHVAFRADLGVGIEVGRLVPFAYFGLKDTVDYAIENIPWRNKRFDPVALERAVQTQERMSVLWTAWGEHPGTRTLVFCCSIAHAGFVQRWLTEQGLRVRLVHSGPGSDDRSTALNELAAGTIDAICTVDLFNEGVDVPLIDRVVMLRPTESPVLFLQQLGRGLRAAVGKSRLTVIDFVGNHRVFLDRVRNLLSLAGRSAGLRDLVESQGSIELPTGCSVAIELEAIDLLRGLLPRGGSEVERVYRELYASRGERPRIGELFRMGYPPSNLRQAHGSWFEFVASEGHLSEKERKVVEVGKRWFSELETASMDKCFKMVVLEALVEMDALRTGLPLANLAAKSHEILLRTPALFEDLLNVKRLANPRDPDPGKWLAYWKDNPIHAWTSSKKARNTWFRLQDGNFLPSLPIAEGLDEIFEHLTLELVDYQLARYRRRLDTAPAAGAFTCKVFSNRQGPILKLPDEVRRSDLPEGETDVRIPDGSIWRFRFKEIACNVARPVGRDRNQLADLLRGWFGPAAGRPGTAFQVRFTPSPDGLWVEPIGQVIELPRRGKVTAFPSLRAAAGPLPAGSALPPEAEEVALPVRAKATDLFAVRASGDSMDGGTDPIRDGDWLLFRYARGAGLGAVEGRVALVETGDGQGDAGWQVKRVRRNGANWVLASDRPGMADITATSESTVIALLVERVSVNALGPPVGTQITDTDLPSAFGLDEPIREGRVAGHLFLLIDRPGSLEAPDRIAHVVSDRRPGETAFVLTRGAPAQPWRYAGVGRWSEAEAAWAVPDVDFQTWRALGSGRGASRRLAEDYQTQARDAVERLLGAPGVGGWVERGGKRCRIVGKAAGGGLRVDGGPSGFAERTVSLNDFAWVLAAKQHAAEHGGVVDEARVNHLRYIDGTPRESTRFIDTGWALTLVG